MLTYADVGMLRYIDRIGGPAQEFKRRVDMYEVYLLY
jgi:hypothetical protein